MAWISSSLSPSSAHTQQQEFQEAHPSSSSSLPPSSSSSLALTTNDDQAPPEEGGKEGGRERGKDEDDVAAMRATFLKSVGHLKEKVQEEEERVRREGGGEGYGSVLRPFPCVDIIYPPSLPSFPPALLRLAPPLHARCTHSPPLPPYPPPSLPRTWLWPTKSKSWRKA